MIVLYLTLIALTAVSIIRLLLRTWSSTRSLTFKILCNGAVIAFIVFCIYDFNNQGGKNLTITIFGAILIISFDWTLGMLHQRIFRLYKLKPIIIIPTLTIGLSFVIFFGLYGLGILLDKLKLLEQKKQRTIICICHMAAKKSHSFFVFYPPGVLPQSLYIL